MIFFDVIDDDKYFIATYEIEGKNSLRQAAWELAIGQSVGNPHMRNKWENDELFENYSCKIIGDEKEMEKVKKGKVKIAFPCININFETDGISQLLCMFMGGNVDISHIVSCRLLDIEFPKAVEDTFPRPKFGMDGVRAFTGMYEKPLIGGIIKPKTGLSPQTLLEIVEELVEGGVNFIKEDEILGDMPLCPIEERVPLVMNYINSCGRNVIYAVCINGDYPYVIDRAKRVYELGGNAVHINVWCGLGVYRSIRKLDLPLFIHFQQSGSRIFTDKSHRYSIDFNVLCKLAGMSGVDTMHIGNLFGYSHETEEEIKLYVDTLSKYNVVPALSCGMHPSIVNDVTRVIGANYLANAGGAIHGHPSGTRSGARAMCCAINHEFDREEYQEAVKKWELRTESNNNII